MIVALPSLTNAKKALFNTIQSKDVKFVKPSKPIQWDAKIIECAFACKILKTLHTRFNEERKDYNFIYISKIFYNESTFNIRYDHDQYCFEVKTGFRFPNGEFEWKNKNINCHEAAEKLLDKLMSQAKYELPSSIYESLSKRCNEIKIFKEY